MSPPRFIITGSGRCGTMWAAQVLRSCGVPCGHQQVFRHANTLGRAWDWGLLEGDSSFEAVPMLGQVKARKIALTREPLAVMRSWRGLGLFVDRIETWEKWGLLSRVLDKHFPTVLRHDSPVGRAALYWLEWTRAAVSGSDRALPIEGLQPSELFDALGRANRYRTCADAVPTNTNTRSADKVDRGPYSWDEVPDDVRTRVRDFAGSIGYE